MKTPKITLRQYVILSMLRPSAWVRIILRDEQRDDHKWHTGAKLRKRLKWPTSLPNFCLRMQRLEQGGLVKGRYCRTTFPDGMIRREREYCLTKNGRRAAGQIDDFVDHFGRRIHGG